MRQTVTIASNAFMELIRQPIFMLLMGGSAVFEIFLAIVPYFGFGQDPKLVENTVLATMFLTGLFGAVMTASASVADEIRSGTAQAVLAKPVGRMQFLLAKYAGVAGALTVLMYVDLVSALLASRMTYDAYGDIDMFAVEVFFGFLAVAFAVAGFTNYFLRRPFVADAVFAQVIMITLSFVVVCQFDHGQLRIFAPAHQVDWRLVPAGILLLFALWILAGLALACTTRFETMPTLAICSGLFLLGLMSDYLFGQAAHDGQWWGTILYSLVPNWQLFWVSDAIYEKKSIPWKYVFEALVYVVGYLGASLAVAMVLFQERELK